MCGDCANFNTICKSIGKCKYANKRSVSLYTVKIRNLMKSRMGKKAIYVILSTEPDCPLKTDKNVIEKQTNNI